MKGFSALADPVIEALENEMNNIHGMGKGCEQPFPMQKTTPKKGQ